MTLLHYHAYMQTLNVDVKEKIYSVSRLNSEVRFLLEDSYPLVWVEGEISNFAAPNSGHWYFSLKDAAAQVRCAMFRARQRKLLFTPKDGSHVLIKARVSLYENRGDFQLIVEDIEERGEGKLRRAFEILKKKLELAGLFEDTHKKPLPSFPKQIGIITSATGAAIHDILTVLKRRFPCVPIIIYPSLVQGETAATSIIQALKTANRRKECDVIIIARGGGSLEDLWPFNDEMLAHAIFQSQIPVLSGVGHEVDFTIADFVADKRAPTPSAAAEMVTPHQMELLQLVEQYLQQLTRHIFSKRKNLIQHLLWMQKNLSQQHPKRRLLERMQKVDFYEIALIQHQTRLMNQLQTRLKDLDFKLHRQTPIHKIKHLQNQIMIQQHEFTKLISMQMTKYQSALANSVAKLDALSPLATLQRGYAIVSTSGQKIVRDVKQVKIGDQIRIRLQKGTIECTVENLNN